jgi:HEPN domain-containing protein
MAEGRSTKVDRSDYGTYLQKADEFYEGMLDAVQRGNYAQACSSAVHCTISSCDAVAVKILGERGSGKSHDEAVRLLSAARPPGFEERLRQVRDVLSLKSKAEYGSERPSKNQAELAARQATRVYRWAKEVLR